jgi:hypothetical protein
MSAHQLLDAAGRPRSPATMPGHHAGRIPPNRGPRYPADPPTVDEIVAVMRQAGGLRESHVRFRERDSEASSLLTVARLMRSLRGRLLPTVAERRSG